MCVAIYKPKGVNAPSLETLKRCWNANPDGAGLAWRTAGKFPLHIEKGFMTWADFEAYWKTTNMEKYEDDLFIHFRITTHGGTSAGNTHPFPVVDNDVLLKTQSVSCKYVMMHNGVLPVTPDNVNISDTMMLAKLIARGGFESNLNAVSALLADLIGTNKLAFMDADGVYLAGNWSDIDGVKFSNENWNWTSSCWLDYKDSCKKDKGRCDSYAWYDDDDDADADEYYTIEPTTEELDMLQEGVCPYCEIDGGVEAYEEYYACVNCGVLYEKPYITDKDRQHKNSK